MGLLTWQWTRQGGDLLYPLNMPGQLLGYLVYSWAIKLVGDPSSSQAHFTVPLLLRTPWVFLPASVLFWGLVGTSIWGASRTMGIALQRTAELVLVSLAAANALSLTLILGLSLSGLAVSAWLAGTSAGLAGVLMNVDGRSRRWGMVTWISLLSLFVLAALTLRSAWPLAMPTLLGLYIAAVSTDARRNRKPLLNRSFGLILGAANALMLVVFVGTTLYRLA